tara:strand:+ start:472 stop:1434 length:963 start_codon:yes stop_codon:yes gene_type:complete
MGGLCTASATELPSYSETVQGTTLPAFVAAGGKELYEQARELAKSEFPKFEGQRVATYGTTADGTPQRFTDREVEGLNLLANNTGFEDVIDDATTMAGTLGQGFEGTGPFTADTVNQYMDTFQTSIDPAIEQLERDRQLRQNQNRADALRAGAFGGSRLGVREAMTDAEISRAGADLRRQAGRDALNFASQRFDADRAGARADFETDEASRLRATETLSQLAPLTQSLTEQQASGLLTAGEAERNLDQQALDLAYQDFLAQKQFPFEMVNFALGALQGIPYETLTRQQASGNQFMQQPSIYGQTIGGLGSLAALYKILGT